MKQRTIAKSIAFEGIGLHTGETNKVTIHPANVNHGIKFKRVDLEKPVLINGISDLVVSTKRSTTIGRNDVTVTTVEHLLAAFSGLGIDNALVEIDGSEVPILDGSSKQFLEILKNAGFEEQDKAREYVEIETLMTYKDEATGAEIIALPSDKFELTVMIDFDSPVLGLQYAQLDSISDFENEIAPARTFTFVNELEQLLDAGLIKGGDLNNAVVIANEAMDQTALDVLAKKLNRESVTITKAGVLNTTDLHFDNEPARHKLLDLVGDLALVGKPIKGKFIAKKPGHAANVAIAKLVRKLYKKQSKLKGLPKYNQNDTPIKSTLEIQAMLPHRYPFLLIDKIIEMSDSKIVGMKNVTINESFFQGHFPGNPVMPGVLQLEAMAQTGGILALSTVPDPENWDTYFLKIDNAKFKAKVLPGDTILFKLELLSPIRRGIVQMQGTAYVGEKIVSEGELTAQIVRRS